ncbi:MAG: hypothetical protein BRD49_00875 [Bacteroidetes bacterium SW_10_40_5]|nr:MAG: hypothetical protein BRD49_00875 [Bacteroidetes bacterium SW_10_40_5]
MDNTINIQIKTKVIMISDLNHIYEGEHLRLQFNSKEGGFLEVSLLDEQGVLIYNYSDYIQEGEFRHNINKNYFKPNKYLIRIAKNGKSEMKEFDVLGCANKR